MRHANSLRILIPIIVVLSAAAAGTGLFSTGGPGPWEHSTVRGTTVTIDGHGVYRHMSADVAPQGRAQDAVTLLAGIPLLLLGLVRLRRATTTDRMLLAGTLMYFTVTYLFYLAMGTYNELFLVYVALLGCSSAAFMLTLFGMPFESLRSVPPATRGLSSSGIFLIVVPCAIALLWLGTVVPPLLDGSVIPVAVQHYTTLIVQGFDLALLLPLAVVTGVQLRRGSLFGLVLGPVYLVFLSLLMTALTAKIVAMGLLGQNIIPAVIIIPAFNVGAMLFARTALRAVSSAGSGTA